MLQNSFLQHLLFSSKDKMQGIETGAEGSVLKYVAKALLENLHTFSDNTIRMCDGVKCSTLWSTVRLLEMFNGWKRKSKRE